MDFLNRGWIINDIVAKKQLDIFYVDYGNVARIDKRQACRTIPEIWDSLPNLYPFRIAGRLELLL